MTMNKYLLALMMICGAGFLSCGDPVVGVEESYPYTMVLNSYRTTTHQGDSVRIEETATAWCSPVTADSSEAPGSWWRGLDAGTITFNGAELMKRKVQNGVTYERSEPDHPVPLSFGTEPQRWAISGSDTVPAFTVAVPSLANDTRIIKPRHGDTIMPGQWFDIQWEHGFGSNALVNISVQQGNTIYMLGETQPDNGSYSSSNSFQEGPATLTVYRSIRHDNILKPSSGQSSLRYYASIGSAEIIDIYFKK